VCTSQPVSQDATEAEWKVTIKNTGDVELDITADDGIGTFQLAAGTEKDFVVKTPFTFTGQDKVSNTVTASWTLPAKYGLANTDTKSDSDDCYVGGDLKLIKLLDGLDLVSGDGPFTFTLKGPGVDTTGSAPPSPIDFGSLNLVPVELNASAVYTLCETNLDIAWMTNWKGDPLDTGTATTLIPFVDPPSANPPVDGRGYSDVFHPNYVPPPGEYINNIECVNFVANAGKTEVFEIDNRRPPGGAARTIGYWKNWNACSNGNQFENATSAYPDSEDRIEYGKSLLEDALRPDGLTLGTLTLVVDDPDSVTGCESDVQDAVNLLDKRKISGANDKGRTQKVASDAAYALAAQLLAALANESVYAGVCTEAAAAITAGQTLLYDIGFNGAGDYFISKGKTDIEEINGHTRQEATDLASTLDSYNNNTLCKF
jgi:hypothetical protein